MLFRAVTAKDLAKIHKLTQQSGIGITTLPKHKALLKERLNWAIQSFDSDISKPRHEYYFFILEDSEKSAILGTSAIESSIGQDLPFYSFKISKRTNISHALHIRAEHELLTLVNDNEGKSELCTLYLEPTYRKNKNGVLLSKARFLFMAQFPQRFSNTVIAEMRGVSDENGYSPFWQHVGQHFFQLQFAKADELTITTNKQFIADLMPDHPIYIKLLPKEAQEVIGKPHQSTIPAMNILLKEGFSYRQYVDIFDAGPTIEASLEHINTIAESQLFQIQNISDEVSGTKYLISNTQLSFRAIYHEVLFNTSHSHCIISKHAAQVLQVNKGDWLRIAPITSNSNG